MGHSHMRGPSRDSRRRTALFCGERFRSVYPLNFQIHLRLTRCRHSTNLLSAPSVKPALVSAYSDVESPTKTRNSLPRDTSLRDLKRSSLTPQGRLTNCLLLVKHMPPHRLKWGTNSSALRAPRLTRN